MRTREMIYRFSQWRTSVVVTLRQKKKKKKNTQVASDEIRETSSAL